MKKFFLFPKYDTNLIVIGAGSAGLVSSYIAATVKARVILIEKHKMGGDCLNTGCVPSKTLIRSAKIFSYLRNSVKYGIEIQNSQINFPKMMARVHHKIKQIEPHDSVARYSKLGVECISGEAIINSAHSVSVNGRNISTRHIIIATGARPLIPDIVGLDKIRYFSSDTIWNLEELPKRLVVLGGGAIGCELALCFSKLGASVTQIVRAKRLLSNEDELVSRELEASFKANNIAVLANSTINRIEVKNNQKIVYIESSGNQTQEIIFDEILIATGRKANTSGFGLDNVNIKLSDDGSIAVNQYLQTNIKNIFACGDVIGSYQFTHVASFEAWYASVNSLFGFVRKFKVDYQVIPWATFTEPEIARVGINEQQAQRQRITYDICQYDISDLDRAIVDDENYGFIRVITKKGCDKILGVTIVANNASEIITEFVLAMKYNLGLNKILSTIHIYPTYSEANKYVAGQWKRKRVSAKLLQILTKIHQWRRGGVS